MTTTTGPYHFIVVNLCRRRPAGFAVTTVTGITGAYMFCALAFCRRSIMTGRTGRQWFNMVSRRRPAIGTMTGIAIQIRGDVCGFFAFGKCAVMTTTASPYHFIVVNLCRRRPAGFAVTTVTGITGIDMFCALTFCRRSIMTGRAGGQWFNVISCRRPTVGTMTGIAIQVRGNMCGFFAFGKIAIMATTTGSSHFIMINFCRRCPAVLAVAAITGIRGADVSRALTFCIGSIMTGQTGRQWFNMVRCRCPAIGAVTDVTVCLSRYMA